MNDIATSPVHFTSAKASSALVFVSDQDSEGVIRQALSDLGLQDAEFIPGDVDTAIAALGRQSSPRLMIVDVSGVDNPSARLNTLAQVCEPGTAVIVIGASNDIRLYRELRRIGVNEYFFKPLVKNIIVSACDTILSGSTKMPQKERSGRIVTFLGVRGGVGATTLAVSTAWNLAEAHKRWVLLIDLDLFTGDAALQLDVAPSHALAEALERPDRVDELFFERGVIHVTSRLDLLASLEPFDGRTAFDETALLSVLEVLRRRYRFVFVDIPVTLAYRMSHILHVPSLCVLVSNGSLVSARDVARLLKRIGPNTPERSTFHILNHSKATGSLPEADFIRAAGKAPDLVVPYHREIGLASNFGIKELQKCTVLNQALAPLLRDLVGEEIEVRPSLFKRLFG